MTPQPSQTPADAELHPQPAPSAEACSRANAGDAGDEGGDEKPWPPIRGMFKGEMWIDPDYDFTRPTFLDWAREVDYK